MKKLSEFVAESAQIFNHNAELIPEIVLAMRLLDGKSHIVVYTDDDYKSYKYYLDCNETTDIKSEVNIIMKTIERFNGQGYKTADELDRLNDLYELSDKEVNLPWYENWWKYTGKIGQDWLH